MIRLHLLCPTSTSFDLPSRYVIQHATCTLFLMQHAHSFSSASGFFVQFEAFRGHCPRWLVGIGLHHHTPPHHTLHHPTHTLTNQTHPTSSSNIIPTVQSVGWLEKSVVGLDGMGLSVIGWGRVWWGWMMENSVVG